MKKALTLILSLVMLTMLLAACSQDSSGTATSTSPTGTPAGNSSSTASAAPAETANRSDITIKVLANSNIQSFMDGEDENNNEIIEFLKQLSGYNLEYQILPSDGGEEKRALIMASGSLPDLMALGRNTYLDYVSQGYLTDLTDNIPNCAPLQATKCMDDTCYAMSLVDGRAYCVCTPTNGSPAPDALVADLEVANGLDLDVDSPDMSLGAIMQMFADAKAAYPDKTVYSGAGNGTSSYKLGDFRWLYAAYDVDTTWRELDDGSLEYCAITDDMHDCLAYIAQMYDEGYLDPEYATVTTETLQERMANHSSCFYGLSWYDWPGAIEIYADADKNTLFPILGQAVGDDGTTGQDQDSVVQNYMVVPLGCEYVDDVLNYIAVLCSDEAYEFLFYGTEGEQFSINADGSRVSLNDPENYRTIIGNQFYVYYYIYEDFEKRCDRLDYMAVGNPAQQERHEFYGLEMKTKLNPAYNMPTIDTYIEHISDLNDCCAEWFLKIATGAVEMEAGWTSFLEEFEILGGSEVIGAVNEWYVNQ